MKPRLGGTFSRLLDELVRERVGLAPSRRHEQAKERVLGDAMKRAGVTDEAMYLELIKRDRKEFDALISDLTVPETYFFRDPPHYELLRREVLPALHQARGRDHVLELWSAGCATGEEPYSLAMLLEQELLSARSHVLGSDVSLRALGRARAGVYGRWSMRATTDAQRARYFEQSGRDLRLVERIRRRVRFEQHSLTSTLYPRPTSRAAGFDLILCRNVLIYFDPAATAATGQRLANSLSEDGFLMLGPSDPLLHIEEWCDTVATPCGLLYRKRRAHEARQRPRPHSELPRPVTFAPAALAVAPLPSAAPLHVPPAPKQPDPSPHLEQVREVLAAHGASAAESGCRELLGREPLSAVLHLQHAMLLLDLGRDGEAEAALRRALYLDRSLLVASMLSATLLERRGAHAEAQRAYEQLRVQAGAADGDEPLLLGDGLTCGALAALAEQRARALASRGRA